MDIQKLIEDELEAVNSDMEDLRDNLESCLFDATILIARIRNIKRKADELFRHENQALMQRMEDLGQKCRRITALLGRPQGQGIQIEEAGERYRYMSNLLRRRRLQRRRAQRLNNYN